MPRFIILQYLHLCSSCLFKCFEFPTLPNLVWGMQWVFNELCGEMDWISWIKPLHDLFWETRILSLLNFLPHPSQKETNIRLGKSVRKRRFHLKIFYKSELMVMDDLDSYLHIWIDSGNKHSSPKHIDVSINSFLYTFQLRKGKLFIFQNVNNIWKRNGSNSPPNCIILR